ncbi:MAG: ATP-binding protein [Clostridiales bacterium]|jgi:anti-sigma regulatory factor (Ser/Thr protein kinase)|nr:ATP-binding protein [Clostridiales bacterium]
MASELDAAIIELVIPMRAEYVSIARLTVSGVANRIGFDFDTIEDIKVSLSEVCNRLIGGSARLRLEGRATCRIVFVLSQDNLRIDFFVDGAEGVEGADGAELFSPGGASAADDRFFALGDRLAEADDRLAAADRLGPALISLLMDEFEISPNGRCVVSMKKYL